MVFHTWVLKISKDGDFATSLCCNWSDSVLYKSFFLMLSRHHKSQLVAVAPCFRIWHCQEFDSSGWRCPSSCRLILLLVCFSTDWKNPVLSVCSVWQVSHYLVFHWVLHSFPASPLNWDTKLNTYSKCSLSGIELKIIIYLYHLTTVCLIQSCVGFVCHSLILLDLLFTVTPRSFSGFLVLSQLLPSLYQHRA